ncbi:MAG: hypothetical protein ABIJ08_03130 [Nanoarchaeota archaeon]
MVSAFRGVIEFFGEIGLYDVVLPFLLVFTIVFAIFEKTRILGTEEIDGKMYPRKNLNAMVGFVIAFFVIASAELVEIITKVSSNVVILLMASVLFLLLVGSFMKEDKEGFWLQERSWQIFFMVIMFIGILLIFLDALNWLDVLWGWMARGTGGNAIGAIILLIIIIFFMWYVVKEPETKKSSGKNE